MKYLFTFLNSIILSISLIGQVPTGTIRGTVKDQDSDVLLIGATVRLIDENLVKGDITDKSGKFILEEIAVGRVDLEVSFLGYEPYIVQNLNVESGKELVLKIALTESITLIEEITISAKTDKKEALNEMAGLSARSFSVEETQRYAASFWDPARMAQNFAGVTSSGDDLSNEIVIRGNSPSYVQWRLEGIEISGPNHFSTKGSPGGGVSMLSSSMLANSDFYTGAFPAEIGNALAGAFDLNFRNGNNEKAEYSLTAGVIGLEASAEGPFFKNSDASYLLNYRYSALQLLSQVANLDFGDFEPNFQDLSFKVNLPTKNAGLFSIFGIRGVSESSSELVEDMDLWQFRNDIFQTTEKNNYTLIGVNHRFLFKDQKSYLKTVVSGTKDAYTFEESFVDILNENQLVDDEIEDLRDDVFRASLTFNHKANARNTIRFGSVFSHLGYKFFFSNRQVEFIQGFETNYTEPSILIDSEGSSKMYQAFAQWKFRPHANITINSGFHYTYLSLTNSASFEPRVSVKWQFSPKESIALSGGYHSQAEHLINYTLRRERPDGSIYQPNIGLELTKAIHIVLGYDHNFSNNLRLKAEAYYQHLYDVPEDQAFTIGSIINAEDVYDVLFSSTVFTNSGKGRNVGIDLTVEQFLNKGFYYLLTGSVFDSSVEDQNGRRYNTRYNSKFNITAVLGKEYPVGKFKQHVVGLNAKTLLYGGNRYIEYNFAKGEPKEDGFFKRQAEPYFRIDISINYKRNKKNVTHTFALEIQNLTNRRNVQSVLPNFSNGTYFKTYQGGIIPNFNYKVNF